MLFSYVLLVLFYFTEIPAAIRNVNGPDDGFIIEETMSAESTTTNGNQSSDMLSLKQMQSCTGNNLSLTGFDADSNSLEKPCDKGPVSCESGETHDITLSGFNLDLSMDTVTSIENHLNDFLGTPLTGKNHF